MELNKENEVFPTNFISEEKKAQRVICWNTLFEKYEKVSEDKSESIDVNDISKLFVKDTLKQRSSPQDSILASSNTKKSFYLNYNSDSNYNKRKRGRPRKIPTKYSDENWSSQFNPNVPKTIYDKSDIKVSSEQFNKSVVEANETIRDESTSRQKFSDKIRSRYWKSSIFEDLIMKPIVRRKQKRFNKRAKKKAKQLEKESNEHEHLKNKTYILSEDFRIVEPYEIYDEAPVKFQSNEETEVIEDELVEVIEDDQVDEMEDVKVEVIEDEKVEEEKVEAIDEEVSSTVPHTEDLLEEKPATENLVVKFVSKRKDVTFTTKHKIEKELKSDLGYMVYKRYQSTKLLEQEESEFWNNEVKMEIQKLSLVISLEEIYKYMSDSLRLWISLTNSNSGGEEG